MSPETMLMIFSLLRRQREREEAEAKLAELAPRTPVL